jgi:opacity protein-like surface antigen
MRKLLLATTILGLALPAHAVDMATKAQAASVFSGYPQGSGFYFGVNTALGTGKANGVDSTALGSNAGTLTTQMGEVGATVGYTWAMAGQPVWWAVEGTFDFSNINAQNPGIVNGGSLSLGGPADFEQIAILGAPWGAVASFIPSFNFNFPTLPLLPPSTNAGVGNLYAFLGLYEQDVSANFGQAAAKTWLVGATAGVGTRWLLSNSTALDIRFEYRAPSQSECVSGFQVVSGCAGMGSSYWARTAVLF